MSQKMIQEECLRFYDDLLHWHDEKVAFIKHDIYEGKSVWMVYNAKGEKIAATDSRDFAFVVARQNDLEPQSAH